LFWCVPVGAPRRRRPLSRGEALVAIKPGDAHARLHLAVASWLGGDHTAAYMHIEAARLLRPADPQVRWCRLHSPLVCCCW